MKKNTLLLIVFLVFSLLGAQTNQQNDLADENARIGRVQQTETLIADFISQNLATTDFSDVINKVNSIKDEQGHFLSGTKYNEVLQKEKEKELRDLYFSQNPSNIKDYYAKTINCTNSGFETGTTAGVSLFYNAFNTGWSLYNMFPTGTNTANNISIVDNSITDQITGLSRVNTGKFAIKLNTANGGGQDVSRMTRLFIATDNFISFSFALVLENANHLTQGLNPYYQVRVRRVINNQIIFTRNVVADPSNTSLFSTTGGYLFTNWLCENIDIHQYLGERLELEIVVADCGLGGHDGYAYFDDFCGVNCQKSSFDGYVNLNALNISSCPQLPLNVTGNYAFPLGSTNGQLTLQILDANNNIINTVNPSANGTNFNSILGGYDFFPNNNFNNLDFKLRAVITYQLNGQSQSMVSNIESLSFVDCYTPCLESIRITNPVTNSVNIQAAGDIEASSVIYPNLNVNYRAGYQIVLKPGFYTTGDTYGKFRAYIAPCDSYSKLSTNAKYQNSGNVENLAFDVRDVKIYPNPSSTFVKINTGKEKLLSWELYDMSGRLIQKGNNKEIDVQKLPKATYLLNISLETQKVTKKVIVK